MKISQAGGLNQCLISTQVPLRHAGHGSDAARSARPADVVARPRARPRPVARWRAAAAAAGRAAAAAAAAEPTPRTTARLRPRAAAHS